MIPSFKRHCVLGESELQSARAAKDAPPAAVGDVSVRLTMRCRRTPLPRSEAAVGDIEGRRREVATDALPNRTNPPKSVFGKNRQQLIMLQARLTVVPFMAFGCDATQTIHRRDTMEALERGSAVDRQRAAACFERLPNRGRPVSVARPTALRWEHDPLPEDGRH